MIIGRSLLYIIEWLFVMYINKCDKSRSFTKWYRQKAVKSVIIKYPFFPLTDICNPKQYIKGGRSEILYNFLKRRVFTIITYKAISYTKCSERESRNIKIFCINIHLNWSIYCLDILHMKTYCTWQLHSIKIKHCTINCFSAQFL